MVLDERRFPNERIGHQHPIRIKQVIRRVAIFLVDQGGHLVPQSQPHGEIRTQLHFILKIPGGLLRAKDQFRRFRLRVELGRAILEKSQQGEITDGSGVVLTRGKRRLLHALEPRAETEAVNPFRQLQVVGEAEVPPGVVIEVLAVGCD